MAIEAVGLVKRFGELTAVDGLSFSVLPGEVFGFLGPNGAGKTTTIRMLTTLSTPTAGAARVSGYDVQKEARQVKAAIGVVPETSNLYAELSVLDNLEFAAHLYDVPDGEAKSRIDTLIQTFNLEDKRQARFATLSKGLKRRATIAAALIHRPQILFLDEPTSGLDVFSARALRQAVRQLNQDGVTVFLTTHNIEEASALCHRVAFFIKGKIVAQDTPTNLCADDSGKIVLEVGFEAFSPPLMERLKAISADGVTRTGDRVRFSPNDITSALAEVAEAATANHTRITYCQTVTPTLEDIFVRLTGVAIEAMRQEKEGGPRGG
jgi:ABC-2 type transport system ATP-binding protein